jgi:very-short-patch-repair endonuclease
MPPFAYPIVRDATLNEGQIEQMTMEIFGELGWTMKHGAEISRDADPYAPLPAGVATSAERDFGEVVLRERLEQKIREFNPWLPHEKIDEVVRKITRTHGANDIDNNRQFHRFLTEGMDTEYRDNGVVKTRKVFFVDFARPENNDFLAVNQLTVIQDNTNKRPDIVLFINGLPIGVVELKNAADANADLSAAYNQIQTYRQKISNLFRFNELCVISDGLDAKIGTFPAPENRFTAWKTVNGEEIQRSVQIDTLTRGVFEKSRVLDIIKNFIVFEKDLSASARNAGGQAGDANYIKKLAAYHQYWVVSKAVGATLKAMHLSPCSPLTQPSPSGRGLNAHAAAVVALTKPSPNERKLSDQPFSIGRGQGEGAPLHYRGCFQFSGLVKIARELRQKQTKTEDIFWELVRDRKFLNLKFRRQHQIGDYIVDFYCHEKKLVVELDGSVHQEEVQKKHDATRDKFLKSSGFTVVRFTNQQFSDDTESVFQRIETLTLSSPSGRGKDIGSASSSSSERWQGKAPPPAGIGEGNASSAAGVSTPSPYGRGLGEGDTNSAVGRIGVVWHTQGSGKSLSMVFYAGKLIASSELHNPTLVIVTDRNDLDGQLYGTFHNCSDLLRQTPIQASSRADLKDKLDREAGGVIFTTIQKFEESNEAISQRSNIIVIADEAHRSQYGLKAKVGKDGNVAYGAAKYMRDTLPNASYIGFTGTPIELDDRSTPAVFGDYIDIYDVARAVEDGATVPIYYVSRPGRLDMRKAACIVHGAENNA